MGRRDANHSITFLSNRFKPEEVFQMEARSGASEVDDALNLQLKPETALFRPSPQLTSGRNFFFLLYTSLLPGVLKKKKKVVGAAM